MKRTSKNVTVKGHRFFNKKTEAKTVTFTETVQVKMTIPILKDDLLHIQNGVLFMNGAVLVEGLHYIK